MLHRLPAVARARPLVVFSAIGAALVILHASALTLPHHWDALNRMHNAHTIAAHAFNPFLPDGIGFLDAQGRPPLLLQVLALTVLLRPYDLIAAHALWLAFAALAVFMTYRLGAAAWHPAVGVIAGVWLAMSPLFFAQSEIVVLEVPLTALTITAAVCLVEDRPWAYVISATALVLAKEAAQFALPGFVLFAWWRAAPQRRGRAALFAAAPFLALVAWMLACKLRYGWFLHPFGLGFVRLEEDGSLTRGVLLAGAYLSTRVVQLGFWDGNWALTALILGALVAGHGRPSRSRLFAASGVALTVFAVYPTVLDAVRNLWLPGAGIGTADSSTQDALAQVAHLRSVLACMAGLGVLAAAPVPGFVWRDPRLWLVGGIVASYLGLFTLIKFRMVRYFLPVYPFLFLVGAAALRQLTADSMRRTAVVVVTVVMLFVSHYWGGRSGPGNVLESNLEFRDMIAVRRAAAEYLEAMAPVRVVASWPETMELRFPFEGYVRQPIPAFEDPHQDADVLYTSPQSSDPDLAAAVLQARPGVALEPLLRLSRRGKSVELFRIVSRAP